MGDAPKSTDTLKAAHVCQFIANDHGAMHGGEGFYDEFYIRDAGYQVMEMQEAGFADVARKAVEVYLKHQRPDGRFESQKNQFDANGQAIWVLLHEYKITGDRSWLERVYPQMRKAADWTLKTLESAPKDGPFAGVLPNAVADGEYLWDGKHHIAGYDLWNLRGLFCTAEAARILGRSSEAAALQPAAESYRRAIETMCQKLNLEYFPPSWEKEGMCWGNTETLWPTELFPANDPKVTATIDYARFKQFGGFVEGTIQWRGFPEPAIHPYMSAYTTMASLVRGDDEQVVEDYFWYLLHSSASHAFPEGIFFQRRFAWVDTIPHVTGACNFAVMLRHMFIHERDGELHLLTAVPDRWLDNGKEIRIQGAPTHFGKVNLLVRGKTDGVEVRFDLSARTKPQAIVLHLPKSRPLLNRLSDVRVISRPDQTRDWSYEAVVADYQAKN